MILMVFAFLAGIALATQATLNSSLGQLLQNSLLATLIAFGGSFAFTTLAFYIYVKRLSQYCPYKRGALVLMVFRFFFKCLCFGFILLSNS